MKIILGEFVKRFYCIHSDKEMTMVLRVRLKVWNVDVLHIYIKLVVVDVTIRLGW